jgi:hypothetical protein
VSHGDDHEDSCRLGRETVQFGLQQTTGLISKKAIIYLFQNKKLI